jgi:hypothetical protein
MSGADCTAAGDGRQRTIGNEIIPVISQRLLQFFFFFRSRVRSPMIATFFLIALLR